MERVGGDETRTEMDGMEVESGWSWKKVEVGRIEWRWMVLEGIVDSGAW